MSDQNPPSLTPEELEVVLADMRRGAIHTGPIVQRIAATLATQAAALALVQVELSGLKVAAQLVCDCLYAAQAEGLVDVLANTEDEQLKDLIERRVLYHHADLQALLTVPTPAPAVPASARNDALGEKGWLIEYGGSEGPVYWIGRNRWDGDHLKAIRFAREKDAFNISILIENTGKPHRVVEHSWSDIRALKAPPIPAEGAK